MVGKLACFSLILIAYNCQAISISPCDENDEQCLISTAKMLYPLLMAGDSSIGTEPLDPVWVPNIDGTLTILKYKFTNVTVRGYADCEIKHVGVNTLISQLDINLDCPLIKLDGNYDMNGRLIVLPVEGVGNFSFDVFSYHVYINTVFNILKTDDDQEYMSITSFNFEAKTSKGAHYELDNLFNGRKDLADTVLKFANENSIEVLKEFQTPILSVTYKKFIKNVNKYLKTIPMSHLFLRETV